MADHESMYCHACHHQWQYDGESIACPACMSASTEIITPDNDPRHFHNRQQESAATPAASEPTASQGIEDAGAHPTNTSQESCTAPQEPTNAPPNPSGAAPANGPTPHTENPHAPRVTFRVTNSNMPHVTFFTFVTGTMPAPPPPTENMPPMTVFGMQFIPPFGMFPMAPPATVSPTTPTESNANQNAQQTQPQAGTQPTDDTQQQPQQQPQQQERFEQPTPTGPQPAGFHPAPIPAHLLTTLLTSLFNPSAAVLGDAVYSQEAFDRIITQLREQAPATGGAPPASQAALERLQTGTKEVDDKMLGCQAKCVVCVEDMVKGERAAVLPCEHFFHGECVTPWLKLHGTCPVCRRSVEVAGEGDVGKGVGGQTHPQQQQQQPSAPGPEMPAVGGHGEGMGGDAMDCS